MALTGYKRSLHIKLLRKINGVIDETWELNFNGLKAFNLNGTQYEEITVNYLSTMPQNEYDIRLAAFKEYVTNNLIINYNIVVNIDEIMNPSFPPYEEDSIECTIDTQEYTMCEDCGLFLSEYTEPV